MTVVSVNTGVYYRFVTGRMKLHLLYSERTLCLLVLCKLTANNICFTEEYKIIILDVNKCCVGYGTFRLNSTVKLQVEVA